MSSAIVIVLGVTAGLLCAGLVGCGLFYLLARLIDR